MEVVGGIASVAGTVAILGLVGQSIDGILKLKKLVGSIRAAESTVKSFVGDLDSLNGTLVSIQELIEKIPEEWLAGQDAISVDVLASQVEKCRDDIKIWENDAVRLNTKSSRSVEVFFKKLRVAGEGSTFNEFHRKVTSHQQGIQLSLDILGRSFDIRSLKQSQASEQNVVALAQGQNVIGRAIAHASEALSEKIEDMSNTLNRVETSSRASKASMSSLASQLSYLIELVSASSGGIVQIKSIAERSESPCPFEWCCDALPGIENAYIDKRSEEAVEFDLKPLIECRYCGEVFDTRLTDWYVRGKHLADVHQFGGCNLLLSYSTPELFHNHLFDFHQMTMNGCQSFIDEHSRPAKRVYFNRGPESKDQNTRQLEEVAETEGIYHAKMTTILQGVEGTFFNARVSQGSAPDLTDLHWFLEREIACLQEEFIIRGHTFEALEYSVKLANAKLEAASKSHFHPLSQSDDKPEYHMISPQLKNEMTKRDWINLWLYEILCKSSTTKIVLRDKSKAASPNDLGTEVWVQEVLKYWSQDEAATGPDQIYELSDGAVDSRDTLELETRMNLRRAEKADRAAKRVWATRRRRGSREHVPGHKKSSKSHRHTLLGTIGVCALDVKARSRPSRNILNRLKSEGEFEVIVFGDKMILDEDIENWPICDFLICFFSDGFPLDKACAYVKLREPFCVNDVLMQHVLFDRRITLRILDSLKIRTPRRLEVSRDGGPDLVHPELKLRLKIELDIVLDKVLPPKEIKLVNDGDTLWVDGITLEKPFVEIPVSSDDHHIWIYYPKSQSGGVRKMVRKIGNKSSEYEDGVIVPRSMENAQQSYIYQKFLPPENFESVQAYTVGPTFCHAETRKSPVVDGLVRRNPRGKEIRYVTNLSNEEITWARLIVQGFKQQLCGFDIARSGGESYVSAVNGWSFVKDNEEYYNNCARILKDMFIRAKDTWI